MILSPEDMIGAPEQGTMDALSDVLRVAQLSGGVFLNAEFTAPWCMVARVAPEMCAPFLGSSAHFIPYHYVVAGELRVALQDEEPLLLRAGECVLFPRNDLHRMGSDLALRATSVREVLAGCQGAGPHHIRHGGGGAVTRLICGYLGGASAHGNPVFASLPPLMPIRASGGGSTDWFRAMFEYASSELAVGQPGSDTVLAKLSEVLFVEAVRRYTQQLPAGETGWLAGLRDQPVARALALMHGNISRNWNVDQLAAEVGLSRSALADRFVRVLGLAPMQYLAQWRMQVAAQSLKRAALPLSRVAEQVGYESEAAFSRAFKKSFGTAPATWRRQNTDS
jgi:AraC-like DNA-binding protein